MSKSKKLNKKKVMKGGGTGPYDMGMNDIRYGIIQKKASGPPFNWKERTFWYFTSDEDTNDSGRLQYYEGGLLKGTYELYDFTYKVDTETQDKMSLSLKNNATKQILKLRAINATQVGILKSIKRKLDTVKQKNDNKKFNEEKRRKQEEIDREFAADVAARIKREADDEAERHAQELKMKKAALEKKSLEEQEKMKRLNIKITTLIEDIVKRNAGNYAQIQSQISSIEEELSNLRETASDIITPEEFSKVDESITGLISKAETFGHDSKFKLEGEMTEAKAFGVLGIQKLYYTSDEMSDEMSDEPKEVEVDDFSTYSDDDKRAILQKNKNLIKTAYQKIQKQNHPDKLRGKPTEEVEAKTKYFHDAISAYQFLFPETVSLGDPEAGGGGKRKSHKHRKKTHKKYRSQKRDKRSRKKRSPHKSRRKHRKTRR